MRETGFEYRRCEVGSDSPARPEAVADQSGVQAVAADHASPTAAVRVEIITDAPERAQSGRHPQAGRDVRGRAASTQDHLDRAERDTAQFSILMMRPVRQGWTSVWRATPNPRLGI